MDRHEQHENTMYLNGYQMATLYNRLHPAWINEWFVMGFRDAQGDMKGWSCDDQED